MTALGLLTRYGQSKPQAGPAPAGTWTDFSEYTLGNPPGDWSQLYGIAFNWDIVAVTGGKALDIGYDDNFSYNLFATWDDTYCPADQDFEVLAKLRCASNWNRLSVGALLAGTNSSPTGYVVRVQPTLLEQGVVSSGGEVGSAISAAVTLDTKDWVWVRFKLDRSNEAIRVKAWQDGDPELGSWMLNRTGTAYSDAGVAGFRTFYAGADGYQCGFFSYAIGGAAAPSP